MSEDKDFICPACKKMFTTKAIEYFDHVKKCNGPNPESPIGITWLKWPPSPKKHHTPIKTFSPYFVKKRPVTRG